MTDETTTEQLAEIDRDMADIERQVAELVEEAQRADYKTQELPEYTPPEGWRVVRFGELLQPGDMWVNQDGTEQRSNILQWDASVVSGGRCIRRIEPQPQPQPQPQPAEYTPPEGWRVLAVGEVLREGDVWVWPTDDQLRQTLHVGAVVGAKQRYIRRIQPQLEPQPEPVPEPHTATIEELRSEVSYVQRLLGESRQRVTQLEELVASLRTINRGCENAVRDAGKENLALKNQLEAVKAELTSVAADRQKLQIELDAAQQVPAAMADRFQEGWNQGTARAVETVLEWLEPIRLVDSAYLANATMQHLPQIMRHLTGLDSHAID